jgi:hypothetical protein
MKTHRYLLSALCLALPFAAMTAEDSSQLVSNNAERHASPWKKHASPLVDRVRRATARYRDISVAINENWVPGTPCVSGPNTGAMGVHFVLPARIGDGVLNADEPEALIYEPQRNGALRLVGVEFIVPVEAWEAKNPNAGPPAVDGHLTNYVGAPNRYGLPSFYELHVWAWEDNPEGSFADWNTSVSCDHQQSE